MKTNQQEYRPLVSIVIPVYNGGNYMRQAIDSALAQTYPNIEIIVVNDGSKDGGETEAVALSYGEKIRYIYKENGGVSSALNEGIRQMRGEYFSWLSHDDVYLPEKVALQMDALQGETDNAVVMCANRQIDENGELMNSDRARLKQIPEGLLDWRETLDFLWQRGCFNGCTLLIHRKVFERCGGFCEELRYSQDLLMWIRIFLEQYSLLCIPQVGVLNRVHNGQLTQTGRSLFHSDSRKIADIVLERLVKVSDGDCNLLYLYAKNNAVYNNTEVVKLCLKAADKNNLFSGKQRIVLHAVLAYGRIRPYIRKIYYRYVKKVKTQ